MDKWDEDTLQLIGIVMSLAKDGWQHKIFYNEHPLGVATCIELSKEYVGNRVESRTFVCAEDLINWVRSPMQ